MAQAGFMMSRSNVLSDRERPWRTLALAEPGPLLLLSRHHHMTAYDLYKINQQWLRIIVIRHLCELLQHDWGKEWKGFHSTLALYISGINRAIHTTLWTSTAKDRQHEIWWNLNEGGYRDGSKHQKGRNEKHSAKPSANCTCAVPLIDWLGYYYAFTRGHPLVGRRESDTG